MSCGACGSPTVPGARFCFACGAALPLAQADAATERRVVTVLFGDLSDFTGWAEDLDPERVSGVTDRVLASLAVVVGEHGGHVDKLTGDGIMAVFGAPTAHEDDADRAVRAAARMQAVVRRLVEQESGGGRRLGLRVGLNTGEVVAGVQAHLSYTVVGDAVNTAARLSDAAGVGAVLAGRDTALASAASASWRVLAPLRLKGKREPVPAYELVALRPGGRARAGFGDEAPFLGRDSEFGLVVGRLLDVVDQERPRALLITGEAGVGKTRLAEEAARFAGELPGARVLWGRCAPYGEGRDLAAVGHMVRTACGVVDGDDVETARDRVVRAVRRLLPDEGPPDALPTGGVPSGGLPSGGLAPDVVAERLQALLGLEEAAGPALPDAATPGSPVGGDRVRQAVAALFTALARQGPLLLALDDVHWATPVMLEGLLDVAARCRGPVLLVALGRPDALDPKRLPTRPDGWWRALPRGEVLPLAPLEESAAERLLRAYIGAGSGDLGPGVRDALLSRAQGNPFFLAELLHLLVDRGVLCREAGRWLLSGDLPDALLPAGVQAVLAARIDDLDGAAKGVLRDASVLGLELSRPALEAVGAVSGHGQPDVVAAALTTLLDRRLLEEDRDDGRGLRFGHTLVRDVAYAGLAKAERARRHAAAAAYASRASSRSSGSDLRAAMHGEQAVRLAREMALPPADPAWQGRDTGVAALSRVGASALARRDHAAADDLFTRALALAGHAGPRHTGPGQVALLVSRARARVGADLLDLAEVDLGPALADPSDGVRAGALLVLGELRRRRSDHDGARDAYVSALAAAGAAGTDRTACEALRQLGLLDYFDGRLRRAEERFRAAYALSVHAGDLHGAGWALQHLAWSATTRGDYALADTTLGEAAAVFADLEDAGGRSWVAGTEAFVRLLQGHLAEASALARSVLPHGRARGERWGVAALLTIDALAGAELGRVAQAGEQAALALARFEDVGDDWGRGLALVAQGAVARADDRPGDAVALLDRAVELTAGRHPVIASLALTAAGYAHLDRGDLEGAEGAAWRAGALLTGMDLEPHAALGAAVLLAQVQRRRGRLVEALHGLDAALDAAHAPALLFPRRQALAHRAGTLLELGRAQEARAAAHDAVTLPSEDVRSHVLALRAYGSALLACGQTQQALAALYEAMDAADATGMRSEVVATRRLLRSALSQAR